MRQGTRKIDTAALKYFWPMRHYLISSGQRPRANIVAVSFCMPVSREPAMFASALDRQTFSAELIGETGQLVVNVPTASMSRAIYYCGYHSGRDVDKFDRAGLTPGPAREVDVPIVTECVAHIEGLVEQTVETGDKLLFIARVVAAYANEEIETGTIKEQLAEGDFPWKVYGKS